MCVPHRQATRAITRNERSHATDSHAKQVYIIQIYTQANQEEYLVTIACSMKIEIIYNRENQSCQIKRYTMSSLCMWGNQNKHGKNRVTMLSKVRWAIDIIDISMSRTNNNNEAREKTPQSESSIKINKHHNQHVNVPSKNKHPSMHPVVSGTLNVQSQDRYPLIALSIATFALF